MNRNLNNIYYAYDSWRQIRDVRCVVTRAHMGSGTFANKTFANRTFANGETPGGVLAKVRWTLPVVTKQYEYRIYVRAHVNVIGIGIS